MGNTFDYQIKDVSAADEQTIRRHFGNPIKNNTRDISYLSPTQGIATPLEIPQSTLNTTSRTLHICSN